MAAGAVTSDGEDETALLKALGCAAACNAAPRLLADLRAARAEASATVQLYEAAHAERAAARALATEACDALTMCAGYLAGEDIDPDCELADEYRATATRIRAALAPATEATSVAHLATPPALTVGAALRWTHAAEYMAPTRDGDTGETCWCQAAGESWRFWRPAPSVGAPRWSSWTRGVPAEDLAAPCRTVPLAEADLDPATRGGL